MTASRNASRARVASPARWRARPSSSWTERRRGAAPPLRPARARTRAPPRRRRDPRARCVPRRRHARARLPRRRRARRSHTRDRTPRAVKRARRLEPEARSAPPLRHERLRALHEVALEVALEVLPRAQRLRVDDAIDEELAE